MSHNSRQKGNKNGFSIFYIKNLKQLEEKMEFQLSRELDHCLAFSSFSMNKNVYKI